MKSNLRLFLFAKRFHYRVIEWNLISEITICSYLNFISISHIELLNYRSFMSMTDFRFWSQSINCDEKIFISISLLVFRIFSNPTRRINIIYNSVYIDCVTVQCQCVVSINVSIHWWSLIPHGMERKIFVSLLLCNFLQFRKQI